MNSLVEIGLLMIALICLIIDGCTAFQILVVGMLFIIYFTNRWNNEEDEEEDRDE